MKNESQQNPSKINQSQFVCPAIYQQENEINLYAILLSLFSQWKTIAVVTFVGTALAVIYLLIVPYQYQAVVQVARPEAADIKALNIRGYESYTPEKIFVKYYDLLRSAELFKIYLKESGWYNNSSYDKSEDELFLNLFDELETEIIRPQKAKKDSPDPAPKLIAIKLMGEDEAEIVDLINRYVKFTEIALIQQIKEKGQYGVSMEIEKIERSMAALRVDAKERRRLLISKIEEANSEKIASLTDEKRLLIIKSGQDKESKIARLKEAYTIAKAMGIKKMTTIDALASKNKNSQMMVSLGGKSSQIHALMGTVYLNSELEALESRKNESLFIPEISQLSKQIEDIKHDEKLITLKERKSDDHHIKELPDLLEKLDQLNRLNFDFSQVHLYWLDKSAIVSDIVVSPQRPLIIVGAFISSGFISLFVILVLGMLRKGQKQKTA